MPTDEGVEIDDCECIKETDAALLIEHAGKERWVPKSVVEGLSDIESEGDTGTLILKRWFAEREGWA